MTTFVVNHTKDVLSAAINNEIQMTPNDLRDALWTIKALERQIKRQQQRQPKPQKREATTIIFTSAFVPTKEAARRIGKRRETISRWCSEGKLTSCKIGNTRFVDVSHLGDV